MNSDYKAVLQRLREERVKLNLTQRLLCYRMKMLQSHYSRAESGSKRFSYNEMKGLCTSDVDIFYVFTGKKSRRGQEFMALREFGRGEILCYLNTMYLLAKTVRLVDRNRISFELVQKQLDFLQYGSGNMGNQSNIFYSVRNQRGYTQQKMADYLGIDIKKLRGLEYGKIRPDSEMVWKMYHLFEISPAYILEDDKGLWKELNYVLDLLENNEREMVIRILENEQELMRYCRLFTAGF